MSHLKISNWDKWQTYRVDRGQPPWIKIHRILLRNPEWQSMTDAEKGQLVSIWMLAADRNGEIPSNAKMVQKLCGLDSPPDLQSLISYGFIVGDARATPERRQSDANVTTQRRVDKSRKDKSRVDSSCPNSAELVAAIPVVFSDDVMRLGQILAQRILDNDPKARIPTTEKQKANWLDSIEKIHRLDGREWPEIEQVINWCQDDGFWKGNILSASKLRKQFPQLLAKMKSNGGKKLAGQDMIAHNRRIVDELNQEERERNGKVQ